MQAKHIRISLAGLLITLAGSVMFSTKAIIVKKAFASTSIDALSLLTLRMILSLPFYIGIALFTSHTKDNARMSGRQWLYVIALGLCGYYLSSLFDFIGLQYVSAGLERLILFLYPTFAVLISAFAFKQKISGRQKLALAFTYVGIGIAYFGELQFDSGSPGFYYGSFLIFLCSITFAFYTAGSGRIIPVIGAAKFTAYAMLASTAGIFTHFIIRGNFQTLQSGGDIWWYGILLALVATVIPSLLISDGTKRIGSNNVAIISSVGPVSTIIQAHFFLGEPILTEQVIGTLLVIAGVLLIGWKAKS
jgi:drug/metabolite transporter (DMT)-like permease